VTVSDADLAEAVRADLVAMMTLVHARPIGEVHADAEATWFLTGASTPNSNGVLHAELPPGRNIAVAPQWRRRGIGAAVAARALLEARALGLEIAAPSADPLGVGLYRKLGFREVSRHLTYVWSPER